MPQITDHPLTENHRQMLLSAKADVTRGLEMAKAMHGIGLDYSDMIGKLEDALTVFDKFYALFWDS